MDTAIQPGSPPSVNGSSTAVKAEPPRVRIPADTPPPRKFAVDRGPFMSFLRYFADLRITVTLLVLSLFLVFWGTLAQTEKGVWTVVAEYFRGPMVWVPLNLVFIKPILQYEANIPGALPYPGGWLLGGLMLANLLAAHIVSFKLTWQRSGILAIHAGIVVMMLGELITGLFAVEGHFTIPEGGSSNHVDYAHAPELAIVQMSDDPKKDNVVVIPTARLRKGGTISDPQLPFDVEIVQYMVNSTLVDSVPGKTPNPATHGQGRRIVAEPRAEGVGVDTESKIDVPSVYATLKHKGTGKALGTYMLSAILVHPDTVEVDGKVYQVNLRPKRVYKDYTFRLDKLDAIMWRNSNKPRDYSSYVHLTNPKENEARDVRIYMNSPLSYQGETFYQASVGQEPGGPPTTTLQVVRNPGWMMPYLSCFMVASGMLFHFGQILVRFINRVLIEGRAI